MSAMLKQFKNLASPSSLRSLWSYLRNVPGGGVILGGILGRMAPYTGTIKPEVVELEAGRAVIRLKDRRAVRNHLNSIHAIALMNLGEVATGVAVMFSLPDGARGIITKLSMEYLKKARGTLTAECVCPPISSTERKEYEVTADLKNADGEVVARAFARWMIGPA